MCIALPNEMALLRLNPYIALEQELYNFINSRSDLSVLSFNFQIRQSISIHQYFNAVRNTLIKYNEPPLLVPNFDFVIRFQRNEKMNSGLTIYYNTNDKIRIIK